MPKSPIRGHSSHTHNKTIHFSFHISTPNRTEISIVVLEDVRRKPIVGKVFSTFRSSWTSSEQWRIILKKPTNVEKTFPPIGFLPTSSIFTICTLSRLLQSQYTLEMDATSSPGNLVYKIFNNLELEEIYDNNTTWFLPFGVENSLRCARFTRTRWNNRTFSSMTKLRKGTKQLKERLLQDQVEDQEGWGFLVEEDLPQEFGSS